MKILFTLLPLLFSIESFASSCRSQDLKAYEQQLRAESSIANNQRSFESLMEIGRLTKATQIYSCLSTKTRISQEDAAYIIEHSHHQTNLRILEYTNALQAVQSGSQNPSNSEYELFLQRKIAEERGQLQNTIYWANRLSRSFPLNHF